MYSCSCVFCCLEREKNEGMKPGGCGCGVVVAGTDGAIFLPSGGVGRRTPVGGLSVGLVLSDLDIASPVFPGTPAVEREWRDGWVTLDLDTWGPESEFEKILQSSPPDSVLLVSTRRQVHPSTLASPVTHTRTCLL
jgi:hypothetical protein